MGNVITHPNVLSHPDVIILYQKVGRTDGNKIYNAMDKTDYRKKLPLVVARYIDLEKLQSAIIKHKKEFKSDQLLSVKLTGSNKKLDVLPINYYTFEWKRNNQIIKTHS